MEYNTTVRCYKCKAYMTANKPRHERAKTGRATYTCPKCGHCLNTEKM